MLGACLQFVLRAVATRVAAIFRPHPNPSPKLSQRDWNSSRSERGVYRLLSCFQFSTQAYGKMRFPQDFEQELMPKSYDSRHKRYFTVAGRAPIMRGINIHHRSSP